MEGFLEREKEVNTEVRERGKIIVMTSVKDVIKNHTTHYRRKTLKYM